jgi:MFS transporter, CP family, cyanate transporter
VPPIVPLIAQDLQLSATGVGFLVSAPVILFALAAIPGSLLITRLGAFPTLIIGLLAVAIGGALRGLSGNAIALYGTTMAMGSGVAVLQPSMPVIVRQWLPSRVPFGTAVYTNGLLVGEVLPVALTLPLVLPLVGGDWRKDLPMWSIPVAITAILILLFGQRPAPLPVVGEPVRRSWWPNWKAGVIWRLGLLFGSINSMYFGLNAFIPGFLTDVGRPDLTSGALTAVNLAQIPASLLLVGLAGRLQLQAWPFVVFGLISFVSVIGLVTMIGVWTIFWCAVLGFVGAAALILGLTLPPLLSRAEDVARTAAAMFTVSYTSGVAMSVVSGALWDLTGISRMAFVPIALCALTLALGAVVLRMNRELV